MWNDRTPSTRCRVGKRMRNSTGESGLLRRYARSASLAVALALGAVASVSSGGAAETLNIVQAPDPIWNWMKEQGILDEFRDPGKRRLGRRSKPASLLSSREWEVMALLAEGLTTDEVAKRLFLSPTTVRVHISSVLRKLRVKDRQSALDLLREEP